MQLFGIVLLAVVSAASAAQLPLRRPKDMSWDPMWASGKSKLLSIGNTSFRQEETSLADAPQCTTTYSCLSCKTAQVCRKDSSGTYSEVLKAQCPSELPYCDYNTGSCSAVPDSTCGEEDSSFLCLRDGYFPDASVSTVYHVCKDLVPHKFECTGDYEVYNAVTKSCSSASTFTPFTCDHVGNKVPYHLSSNYFGYCGTTENVPSTVDKCRGNTKLNTTSQECETMCEKEGVLPDVEDCSKYYRCDSVWFSSSVTTLVKTRKSCPSGTSFSYVDSMCIDSATNEYCATDLQ